MTENCRLSVEVDPSLAKLAWFARVSTSNHVQALVGEWVELGASYFYEGCWNGDPLVPTFWDSYSFMGSGAFVGDEEVVFATPCHTTEPLYSLRIGEEYSVSNSIPLLLEQSGCTLDTNYLEYESDILSISDGIRSYIRTIPINRDRQVSAVNIHYYCNIHVSVGRDIEVISKPECSGFDDFTAYRSFLTRELEGIGANALDPRRKHSYPPIVFCSTGYDSSVCAVLGKQIGCDEAVVFESKKGQRKDSGKDIVQALGYGTIHEKDEKDYLNIPSASNYIPMFVASGELGTSVFFAAAHCELTGKMHLSGVHGDKIWDRWGKENNPNIIRSAYPDTAKKEYRLAVGYLTVLPAFLAISRHHDLHRISNSAEMRTWQLDNSYDRPIPRRIVEDAGVNRQLFGQHKDGGAGSSIRFGTLNMLRQSMPMTSHDQFAKFLSEMKLHRKPTLKWIWYAIIYWIFLGVTFLGTKGFSLPARLIRVESWPRRYKCSPLAPSYLFHWGVHTVQNLMHNGHDSGQLDDLR